MGMFNFVKSAGEKLFGINGIEKPDAPARIQAEIEKHDLGIEDINIEVNGDKVILTGKCV